MSSLHVKKGDKVLVLTKVRKGESSISKVLSTNPENNTVIVENVRIMKRHKKARSAKESGGIIKEPAPIHASNVMVICPACDKPTRTSNDVVEGKKVRKCKKCGAVVDVKAKREKKAAEKKAKAGKEETAEKKAAVEGDTAEKKPAAKKPKAAAEKPVAEKKEAAVEGAEKPAAEKKPAAKKPVAEKKEAADETEKPAAEKKPAAKKAAPKKEEAPAADKAE